MLFIGHRSPVRPNKNTAWSGSVSDIHHHPTPSGWTSTFYSSGFSIMFLFIMSYVAVDERSTVVCLCRLFAACILRSLAFTQMKLLTGKWVILSRGLCADTYTPSTSPRRSTSAADSTDSGSWWSCWWYSFCHGDRCTPCFSARCGGRSPVGRPAGEERKGINDSVRENDQTHG